MMKPDVGRYEREVSTLLEATGADVVLLVVIGGSRGHGFSVAVNHVRIPPGKVLNEVPALLRAIADNIEEEQKGAN